MPDGPQRRFHTTLDAPLSRKMDDAARLTGWTHATILREFVAQAETAKLLSGTPSGIQRIVMILDHLTELERLLPDGSYAITTIRDHLTYLERLFLRQS